MARIILIIGLPGSGKTYLAKARYEHLGYELVDEPKDLPDLSPEKDYVICDPHLCDPRTRELCRNILKDFEIEEIYFENDPQKCQNNINNREGGRKVTLKAFNYEIPKGIKPLKIWQSKIK